MKQLLLTCAILLVASSMAFAQSNDSYVDQTGASHMATVDQTGADNFSDVDQMGSTNDADIDQTGDLNKNWTNQTNSEQDARTTVFGDGNLTWTDQTGGSGNDAVQEVGNVHSGGQQYGHGNKLDIDQIGAGNTAKQFVHVHSATKTSDLNDLDTYQQGRDNNAMTRIEGDENYTLIRQIGVANNTRQYLNHAYDNDVRTRIEGSNNDQSFGAWVPANYTSWPAWSTGYTQRVWGSRNDLDIIIDGNRNHTAQYAEHISGLDSDDNTMKINIVGNDNNAYQGILGDNNNTLMDIDGSFNGAFNEMVGDANTSLILVDGNYNEACVSQFGDAHYSKVTQNGNMNTAKIKQSNGI